jgi:hypothetical protein
MSCSIRGDLKGLSECAPLHMSHQLNSELAVIGIDNGKNLSAGLVRRQMMKCWSLKMCQSLVTGACATAPSA